MKKILKTKKVSILLVVCLSLVWLGVVTEVVKANTNGGTYIEEVNGIKWVYTIYGENAIDVYPVDRTQMKSGGSITSVTIPDTLGGNPVTAISVGAFDDCTGLTSISMPDRITSIGSWTFENCTSLKGIIIPKNVTNIDKFAFAGCTNLTGIIIPEGVTKIRTHTFANCTSLTSVSIPENVTSLEIWAFIDCKSLKSVSVPDTVTSFEEWVFNDCISLTKLYANRGSTIGSYDWENSYWLPNITIDTGYEAGVLSITKSNGISSLENYKDPGDYRTAEKIALATAVSNGKAAVEDSKTLEAATTTFYNTKAVIDAIKTDAEFTAEEELLADINDDRDIDIIDIALVANSYNAISGDSKYKTKFDLNKDNIIDIYDLVFIEKNIKEKV